MSRKRALSVMDNAQYSSTITEQERWANVYDFPDYCVSDTGRVVNDRTRKELTPTRNTRGHAIVGLMKDGNDGRVLCKRSVTVLVANEFVNRERPAFDTPINLDGDRMNNHYTNIMWRPLWFARKYHRQFVDGHPTITNPIEDVETGEVYNNSMHAAVLNGLLDVEIYTSMVNNTYVWPTGQVFREVV